jgi:hypothetical protein
MKGLVPEKIITHHKWTFPFKSNEEKYSWKLEIIKRILNENGHGPGAYDFGRDINKIVYIDNDMPTNNYLNDRRANNYQYIAVTVPDFINGTYNFLL